jgi:hypothetical protein
MLRKIIWKSVKRVEQRQQLIRMKKPYTRGDSKGAYSWI